MMKSSNMTWKRLRISILAITVAANVFGAAVLYIYFALVEPGHTLKVTTGSARFIDGLIFSVVLTSLVIIVFTVAVGRFYRLVPKDAKTFEKTVSTERLAELAGAF